MQYREDDEVRAIFISETKENLATLEVGIIALEEKDIHQSINEVEALFRAAHSMKASANLLEMKNIEAVAHELENILDKGRSGTFMMSSRLTSVFLKGIDTIKDLLKFEQMSDDVDISPMIKILKESIK